MEHGSGDFDALTRHATPYAKLCGDLQGFARDCAKAVEQSGEPAFYLTAIKPAEAKRFPSSLEMRGYDERERRSIVVGRMEITRPDYTENPHGFKGNHLVVALLESARRELQALIPDGIAVLTSQTQWKALIQGEGYRELKTQRALNRAIAQPDSASTRRAQRL